MNENSDMVICYVGILLDIFVKNVLCINRC